MLEAFASPRKVLAPDEAGRKLLCTSSAACNIKASMASENGDYESAARWAAAPWKIGVLAGLLLGFDAFVGDVDSCSGVARKLHALLICLAEGMECAGRCASPPTQFDIQAFVLAQKCFTFLS